MEGGPITRRATGNPPEPVREIHTVKKTNSFKETFKGRLDWKIRHCDLPMTSTPVVTKQPSSNKTEVLRKNAKSKTLSVNNQLNDHSILSPIHKPDPLSNLLQEHQPYATPSITHRQTIVSHQPHFRKETTEAFRAPKVVSQANGKKVFLAQPALNFNQLLYRYANEEERKENDPALRLHLEPTKVKTYTAVPTARKLTAQGKDIEVRKANKVQTHGTGKSSEKKSKVKKGDAGGTKTKANVRFRSTKSADASEAVIKKSVKPAKKHVPKLTSKAVEWIQKTNAEFAEVMNFNLCVEKY